MRTITKQEFLASPKGTLFSLHEGGVMYLKGETIPNGKHERDKDNYAISATFINIVNKDSEHYIEKIEDINKYKGVMRQLHSRNNTRAEGDFIVYQKEDLEQWKNKLELLLGKGNWIY